MTEREKKKRHRKPYIDPGATWLTVYNPRCTRQDWAHFRESRKCTHGLSPHFTSHPRIQLPTGGNLVGRLWATTTAWLWITEETPTKGDSEATTGAHSIIFYPNGFKFKPMLWSTGTRRFLSCPISCIKFCHCHWSRQKAGRTCFILTEAKD